MTEYWKSNDRKFCEFCKCWITDNKPSVQFHENGKRHQANVQKRITEMSKQSFKDQRAQTKLNDDIRRMNEAAMKSYMKDIEGTGDISSQAINEQLKASQSSLAFTPTVDPMLPPPGTLSDDETSGAGGSSKAKKKKPNAANPNKGDSMWVEALSEEGDTYYWNVKTNESVWVKPKEGYMTLKEYEKLNEIAVAKQEEAQAKDARYAIENADELAAKYMRERLTVFKVKHEKKAEEEESENRMLGPAPRPAGPYGTWEQVEYREEELPNLQLPKAKEEVVALYIPAVKAEKGPKRFSEKTVGALDAETSSSSSGFFKKRKLGAGARNQRQRVDDE